MSKHCDVKLASNCVIFLISPSLGLSKHVQKTITSHLHVKDWGKKNEVAEKKLTGFFFVVLIMLDLTFLLVRFKLMIILKNINI